MNDHVGIEGGGSGMGGLCQYVYVEGGEDNASIWGRGGWGWGGRTGTMSVRKGRAGLCQYLEGRRDNASTCSICWAMSVPTGRMSLYQYLEDCQDYIST